MNPLNTWKGKLEVASFFLPYKNLYRQCVDNVSFSHFFFFFFTEICQLRLDFTNFDIVETAKGVCTDSLTIAGSTGRNPMDLCGTLTGMHGK